MPVSASVFRRGGPKKELFDVINEDVDESKELDEKLAELTELLHLEKSGKELSAALWRPHLCAAELVKQRKHTARDIGFIRGRRIYLHIEEAVFLVDRGDLLLFAETDSTTSAQRQRQRQGPDGEEEGTGAGAAAVGAVPAEEEDGEGGNGGGGGGGRRGGGLQHVRLLSMQEAFDLMMCSGVPLERYLLYSGLSRSGYLVMRHPSRWLLRREERPEQIWGYGAWAGCYSRQPHAPGSARMPPMQHQLPPADAPPSSHAPAVGSAAAAAAAAAAMGAGVGRQPAAGAGAGGMAGAGPASASAVAAGAGGGPTAAVAASRGWWGPLGPRHPMMAGVEELQSEPGVRVTERALDSLLASFPLLQPLPTLRAAAPHLLRPTTAAADDAATATGAAPGGAEGETSGATAAVGASGAASGFVSLGTPRHAAHLVYDVYKPGSFVSRYKGQFPAVHTHVAMCSESPPALGEMWAADGAAAVAAAGEGGKAGSVTWAAVLNGDIALYSIGQADLLRLM